MYTTYNTYTTTAFENTKIALNFSYNLVFLFWIHTFCSILLFLRNRFHPFLYSTIFSFTDFLLHRFDLHTGPVVEEGASEIQKPYNENRKESLNTNYSVITINDRSTNNGNNNNYNYDKSDSSYNNNNSSNNNNNNNYNKNNDYNNNDVNNEKNKNNNINSNFSNISSEAQKIYGNKSESVISTARPAFQKASSIIKNTNVGILKPSTGVRTYFPSISKTDSTTANSKKDDDVWMNCVGNENNNINGNGNNNFNGNGSQNNYQNRMKRNNDEIEIEKQIRDSRILASNISKKVRSSD